MAKGIYKRGTIWWIRYADPYGKIRYESSKSSSFKVAQHLLIQRKKEVMEGKTPIPVKRIENHSFKNLSEHYLSWVKTQKAFKSKKGFVISKQYHHAPVIDK